LLSQRLDGREISFMGPGQGFEPWRKAPQASMLPSYITPATFYAKLASRLFFPSLKLGFVRVIANSLFSFAEDFPAAILHVLSVIKTSAMTCFLWTTLQIALTKKKKKEKVILWAFFEH
jgi:hypothetical protein